MKMISINSNGVGTLGKQEWIRGLRKKNKVDILGIQETKVGKMDSWLVNSLWGDNNNEFAQVDAIGASGGYPHDLGYIVILHG